ncbi:MAG: thioesterase family protein [Porticoccaceae bacterium]|jgi:acyl-CoA thioester hydrolase
MLRHTRQPRDAEINAGHVVNTVPPVWFEDARFGLYAPIQELSGPDALFGIVRKASYDYQRELLPGAPVTILTGITRLGNSSAVFYQEAWQHDQRAVSAETVILLMDGRQRRKMDFSPASRRYLEQLLMVDAR